MKLKLFLILYILLLGCEYEDCESGQRQKIDEVCYSCENNEWVIADCAEWGIEDEL